jgi:hypothetical protein
MLFSRCGPHCAIHAAADRDAGGGGIARGKRPYTVDLHCHVITPGIERLVAARPEKASELAQLATQQLQYAVRDLGNPAFASFWDKASELGCVVLIHPFGTSVGQRLERYYLGNIVGQPLETTIAVRPEARVCRQAPHEYLKRIWFDSIVYDAMGLRHLIDRVGVSQVVLGTDYPFDMGRYAPHELINAVASLTAADRDAILGGNALMLIDGTRNSRKAANS